MAAAHRRGLTSLSSASIIGLGMLRAGPTPNREPFSRPRSSVSGLLSMPSASFAPPSRH